MDKVHMMLLAVFSEKQFGSDPDNQDKRLTQMTRPSFNTGWDH